MKSMIRLTDYTREEILEIFRLAGELETGGHRDALRGKTAVLFFPGSSIRTRVTFEKGIHLLGGQAILFSPEALDKKENLRDLCGYLNNWADLLVVRHKDIRVLEKLEEFSAAPVINAMTDVNHPCEVLSDLYALSRLRKDFTKDRFLFCGKKGNIGLAWKEAAAVMGFELEQCCGYGYEMEGVRVHYDILQAVIGKDIVCTDSLPEGILEDFQACRVTPEAMAKANSGALLNPCPPFYRGEEVSEDVIDSEYFVGYEFKKCLVEVQQAVIIYCLRYGTQVRRETAVDRLLFRKGGPV